MNIILTSKARSILEGEHKENICYHCLNNAKYIFIYKSLYFENWIANAICEKCQPIFIKDIYVKFDCNNFDKEKVLDDLKKLILLQ